jgi:dihydroxyacid dehydratase/phosphogluconate dehydratase
MGTIAFMAQLSLLHAPAQTRGRRARRYLMKDVHHVGGTPAVLKYLLAQNLLDGDCKTCTTHPLAKNLEQCPELKEGQDVILPVSKPIKETGHLQILTGNLAPDGSVAKITGKEGLQFRGPAAVFDSASPANGTRRPDHRRAAAQMTASACMFVFSAARSA